MLKKRIVIYPIVFIFLLCFFLVIYYMFFIPPKKYNGTFVYEKNTNNKEMVI